jgi:cytoskeletal protein CcmA (bactofilin family)
VSANFFGQLDTGSLTCKRQILIKGESYEKNNYVGNDFSDAAGIYRRMLGAVG